MDEKILEKIIVEISLKKPQNKKEFDNYKRQICNSLHLAQPANNQLLLAYQKLLKKKRIKKQNKLEYLLRKATIRTLSGVAIITSLTKPYPCPGQCVYCPNQQNMPKSYIDTEPAAARALKLNFDPYLQMQKRILTLEKNGHPTDKIEFIVKGGTWNAYPLKYQYWFILESFKACNNFKRRQPKKRLYKYQHFSLDYLKKQLYLEQRYNETSKHRIIGLTLETRPDAINYKTIQQMREQGCTRIELGLQATDNKILKLIKRGHSAEDFQRAIFLLRQSAFKVDLHFMPMLPGSSPQKDVQMYKEIFSNPGYKPDMIKIYPCTVIENTELEQMYKTGYYKPYSDKKLFSALIEMKINTPRYARISRLIRDIPTQEIQAGNKITNLRELLKIEMTKQGLKCQCLRCREIGHLNKKIQNQIQTKKPQLFIDRYSTIGGTEYFLSFEDKYRQAVFAFLRLRIPNSNLTTTKIINQKTINNLKKIYKNFPCLVNSAHIRELHTYGQLLSLNRSNSQEKSAQHKGLGKKLIQQAEKIAKQEGKSGVVIISGVGVRDYYRHLGYKLKQTYMYKKIK